VTKILFCQVLTLQKYSSLVICISFKKRKPMCSDRNSWKICYPSKNANQHLIWTTKWKQSKYMYYLNPELLSKSFFILSVPNVQIRYHLLLCCYFSAFSKCCDIYWVIFYVHFNVNVRVMARSFSRLFVFESLVANIFLVQLADDLRVTWRV